MKAFGKMKEIKNHFSYFQTHQGFKYFPKHLRITLKKNILGSDRSDLIDEQFIYGNPFN
jgi:hypothetical protein